MQLTQDTGKKAYQLAKDKISKGEVPIVLGVKGLLALMYDSICRHNKNEEREEIKDLVAKALCAYQLVLDQEEWEKEEEEEPWEEQESPRPSVDIHAPPPEEEPDPIPEKLQNWENDPTVAVEMKRWALETGNWDRLSEEQIIGIEEVIAEINVQGQEVVDPDEL